MVLVEKQQVLTSQKISHCHKNQRQEHLSTDQSLPRNLEDSMTEEIYPLPLNMDHKIKSIGKSKFNSWIIIIICQFSLKESEKNKIHIDS